MATRVQPLDVADVAARPHRYFRRKYVWQWPIRIFHWINAICVTALFFDRPLHRAARSWRPPASRTSTS